MSLQLTNALDSISHCTNRREPPRRSRELTTMFGHRSPIPPDPAMLARVSDDVTEVSFGTYPEAALAVLGVNPAHGPPRKPSSEAASPFDQLDGPARDAAMQAALNQLIAAGKVQFPTCSRQSRTACTAGSGSASRWPRCTSSPTGATDGGCGS
jgi:hypothetical protein